MNWSHNDRQQRFYIFESHCRWLDAQALAGIDDNMLARGAVAEVFITQSARKRPAGMDDGRTFRVAS
jgi:hypothetical protein